ncbi:transglycosylase SLT domain-containing protein [Croceibacterium sp. TMG7-5b_MA50]|uniref:transglycosylase SLT domain-containing protein n=1 Tax=Croceibacterium sp. TMG7-5b_MA50 TaxID=3121290 RepID=UPI00322207C7
MPTLNAALPGTTPAGDPHAAIARAAAATGVDFNYLLAQARIESGLNPDARAGTSSAAGLFQFVNGTWLDTLDRHGAQHGYGWAEGAITRSGGRARVSDPSLAGAVMNLRHDADAAALMAAELARDNAAALRPILGREPDAAELYLAHFMGQAGARDFLQALQSDPGQSAAALFPAAAASNRAIFHGAAGPRSIGQVMDLLRTKMSNAMTGNAALPGGSNLPAGFRTVGFVRPVANGGGGGGGASAPRPSMADTLRSTFGSGEASLPGRALAHVDAAYGKLRAFNL